MLRWVQNTLRKNVDFAFKLLAKVIDYLDYIQLNLAFGCRKGIDLALD